jgi:hypothetical protein
VNVHEFDKLTMSGFVMLISMQRHCPRSPSQYERERGRKNKLYLLVFLHEWREE